MTETQLPRHVVLIGMMGVGKTTVGRLLAARLGYAFWDNDEALEAATGTTADEMQSERGQLELHKSEDALLYEALESPAPTVYAAAASVVLNPQVLSGAFTVWLRATVSDEELNIARSGQHHRPLPPDAAAFLEQLNKVRMPAYARAANAIVDAADDPAGTCERVMESLGAVRARPAG